MRIHLQIGSLEDPRHDDWPLCLNGPLFPDVQLFYESVREIALDRFALLIHVIDIEEERIHPTSHEFDFRHTHHASFFVQFKGRGILASRPGGEAASGGAPTPTGAS